jgi:hypothetical protein
MSDYRTNPKGHKWFKNEDGNVDIWRVDVGFHNGPKCELCGYSFCEHCKKWEDIPECTVKDIEADFVVMTDQKLLT